MNQPAQTSQSTSPRRPGLLARLLRLPLHLFGLLCGALLLALTLQALGTLLFWPQQGWRHADGLAQKELAGIQAAFYTDMAPVYTNTEAIYTKTAAALPYIHSATSSSTGIRPGNG